MASEDSALVRLWDEQKVKVVFISAFLPLVAVIVGFLYGYDKDVLIKLGLALAGYQLAFLIALVFETQRIVSDKKIKKITKIQLNDAFWKEGRHYKTLYLNALNGDRFFEMIANHGIKVDNVKVISPSRSAIDTYYQSDVVVHDQNKAAQTMNDSIDAIEANLSELKNNGTIGKVEVRRLGTFPLDFYAIFDSRRCLVGKYVKDPLRKHTIGLKSLSWLEESPQLVTHHSQHFEELWDSLVIKR